jgi:hypothetical protein
MGHLGYFYVEAKSFEFHHEIGFGGIRLAEECFKQWSWAGQAWFG